MAAIYEDNVGVSRRDIQAAFAKAVELRALHAALMQQGNSPAKVRFAAAASPVSCQFSAQDYPVFTPSYEDEPLPGYQQNLVENQNYPESWSDYKLDAGINVDESALSDYREKNSSSRNGVHSKSMNLNGHICPHAEDQTSIASSFANNPTFQGVSPGPDYSKARRNSMGDIKSVSSCNKCRPAVISSESEGGNKNMRKSNTTVVPYADSHSSPRSQTRNKGMHLSWLFPKLKKKGKNVNSPNRSRRDQPSPNVDDVESLKRDLAEANESRNRALNEAAEMKSSLGEISEKLEYLETYCEELKKGLRQTTQAKNSRPFEKIENSENSMPVTKEVMIEGFLQVVSEARLSVKHFCKTLVSHIEETDHTLVDNLNSLLEPYKLSLNSKYSKAVLYHLESIVNQSLHQDFENCVFRKNGAPKFLDPHQDRISNFQSFVSLRNLSWNEVLRKGTKYYSDEFSKFCDQKMSCVLSTLGWTRPWPEQMLQAFFVAAKCVWLLHLLAFSFSPCLGVMRVEENRSFDVCYMEDIFSERQRGQGFGRVKVMVMPGFYVHDRVVKCKVLCRYKAV